MLAESVKSTGLNEIYNSVSKAPEISKFAGSPIWCHKCQLGPSIYKGR